MRWFLNTQTANVGCFLLKWNQLAASAGSSSSWVTLGWFTSRARKAWRRCPTPRWWHAAVKEGAPVMPNSVKWSSWKMAHCRQACCWVGEWMWMVYKQAPRSSEATLGGFKHVQTWNPESNFFCHFRSHLALPKWDYSVSLCCTVVLVLYLLGFLECPVIHILGLTGKR